MLTMVIADDEDMVREGLSLILPWKDYGIEIVGLADNGKDAYELCSVLKPDILCTDIRMPMMDGLEVAQRLQEDNSATRVILISGVQDFEYAKTALSLEAEAYVLKPVKIPELLEVVQKVSTSIQLERSQAQMTERLHRQLRESMPVLRERLLIQLISRDFASEHEAAEKAAYYGIELLPGEVMTVGLLQLDDYKKTFETYNEENKQLLFFALLNVVSELLAAANAGFAFANTLENELVILFKGSSLQGSKPMQLCEEIIACVGQFVKVSVSIGLGSPVTGLLQLSRSYSEADSAIRYTFFSGKGSVVTIDDLGQNLETHEHYRQVYQIENQMLTLLKLGDSKGVQTLADRMFDQVILPSLKVEQVHNLCTEFVFHLARTVHELDESFDAITGMSLNVVLGHIEDTVDSGSLRRFILELLGGMSSYFFHKHHSKNQKVAQKIKTYIDQHYMENITIQQLAEIVFLSPTYMCQIYKKENNETIIEYLTKVRVDRAMELMKSPDLKLFEIAEMVGFENATYFTTVFKKLTGVLPGKYRETL
ncbi:response regulator [Paenibacillus glycanilyticus]|uniref:AraC family transcriptional regulator n=1 Tax=Paenibacillus glycanilyticus TaxID=126569 RepID=A0ABQ6GBA8_9BACL|nr:response regulator [Paenibacillus glycanilyticus]GLX66947.1 AraC family transcriptional regulator [Paenibacillus glycanilyticus]